VFWNVTPSRAAATLAGWSHSARRWFEVGVQKASTGVVGVSATIRQHGKGSATCVCVPRAAARGVSGLQGGW
jgi:hypothetical protein